jgi:hypothetical protein
MARRFHHRQRAMTPLLFALLLSATPQPQAAAAPIEYSDAKRLADADEASVTGATRDALLAAQAALLDAGVAECNRQDLRGDVTPFVVVMRLDAQGRVQQTWREGGSPLAICLQRYVRDKTLVAPPRAPFHAALEISFTK